MAKFTYLYTILILTLLMVSPVQARADQESLSQLIPLTDKILFLKNFATQHVQKDTNKIAVTGTIGHSTKLVITKFFDQADAFQIDAVNQGIPLNAIVPEAGFLDLSFMSIAVDGSKLSMENTIQGRMITTTVDLKNSTVTLSGADIRLRDLFTSVSSPVLDAFRFDGCDLDYGKEEKALILHGDIKGTKLSAIADLTDKSISIGLTEVHLRDILPGMEKLALLDLFAPQQLIFKDNALMLNGKVGTKDAAMGVDDGKGPDDLKLMVTGDHLGLGDVVPQLAALPGIDTLGFDKLTVSGNFIETEIDINGHPAVLVQNIPRQFTAFYLESLDAGTFIPALDNAVIDRLGLENALFVFPDTAGGNTNSIVPEDLPEDLRSKIDFGEKKIISLADGITVAADAVNVFKDVLEKIGIYKDKLPLRGVTPKALFSFFKHADPRQVKPRSSGDNLAFLKGISLSLELPAPQIPGLNKFLTFHDAMISLSGDMGENSLWNRLPAAMAAMKPKGDLDISLQGGITLSLENFNETMDALIDLNVDENAGTDSISLIGLSKGSWKDPFGIKGVTCKNGGFDIALSKTQTQKGVELAFFGTADVHEKENLAIRADFDEKSGQIPVFQYISIDGPLKVSDLNAKIPEGDRFEINTIKLDPTGMEAKVKLFNAKLDAYFFEYKNGVTFAVDLASFKLGNLVPEHSGVSKAVMDRLNSITLPRAALVASSNGIMDTAANLPDIGKDLFNDIYKNQSAVKIDSGISFIGKFSADAGAGHIPAEMQKLLVDGISGVKVGFSETATVTGTIKGVLDTQDPFGLDLALIMDSKVDIKLPQAFQRTKTDVAPGFFLRVMPDDAMIGVELDVQIEVENTLLDFTAGFGIGLDEEGLDLNISGQVNDNLRIPIDKDADLIISNITVDAEIKDDGTLHLGLGGKSNIDNHELDIAGDLDFNIPARLPDGIAFRVSLDKLDYIAYYYANLLISGYVPPGAIQDNCILQACEAEVPPDPDGSDMGATLCAQDYNAGRNQYGIKASDLDACAAKQKDENVKDQAWAKKWGEKEAGVLTFENGYLSFGTPGAEDPILQTSAGVSMGVDLTLFKQHLGSPSIALHKEYIESLLQKAKSVSQKPEKILKITAGALDTAGTPADSVPEKIRNVAQPLKDFNLGLIAFKGNQLYQYPFRIKSQTNLFGKENNTVLLRFDNGGLYFDEKFSLAGMGSAEMKFTYDEQKDDYLVEGILDSSFGAWLDKEVADGLTEVARMAADSHQKLSQGLQAAEKDVETAQKALADANGRISLFIHNAPSVVNAQKALDNARNTFANAEGDIDGKCRGLKFDTLISDCKKANHYIFDDAQKAVDQAKTALDDAEKMVAIPKALTDATNAVKQKLDNALADKRTKQSLLDIIEGAEAFMDKELKQLISAQGKTLFAFNRAVFAGDYRDILQHGKPFVAEVNYTIGGKPKTSYLAFKPFDPEYTARTFALIPAMVLEALLTDTGLPDSQKDITTWLLALVNQQITDISKTIQTEVGQDMDRYKKVLDTFETDGRGLMQARVDFMDRYGKKAAEYSMTDMMPPSKTFNNRYLAVGHSSLCLSVAPNSVDVYQQNCRDIDSEQWTAVSLDNGYVQLKTKGLCLKAKNAGERGSGQPLVLSQCNSTDLHEQWKIISQDGFFDKIVNKFSQKCLHFDTENANPQTAYAVWTSCLGAASQMFRDIDDAERSTWHPVKDMIQAENGYCLAPAGRFPGYFKKDTDGPVPMDRNTYKQMQQKGDDVLQTVPCNAAGRGADTFNYLETVDGAIKIVHADSGWCVVPTHTGASKLLLAPCNANADMTWQTTPRGGNLFELVNRDLKQCMTLTTGNQNGTPGKASLSGCNGSKSQLIDFVQ